MIEIAKIRNNHQELIERLRIKNFDAEKIITDILVFDKKKIGNDVRTLYKIELM